MTPTPPGTDAQRVALLLVDDRKENLLALEALLDSPGHELVRAQSGQEALKAVEATDFAVVLLDVRMPVMDGYEVAARIRKGTRNQLVPILFLTADDRSADIESAFALGAADYIQKPLNPTFLRGKVATFVELFRQKLQIEELLERTSMRASQAEGEAERLRNEEHDLLRAVVDDSSEGILVADQHGIVRAVNPEALRQRGAVGLAVGADVRALLVGLRTGDGPPMEFDETPLARALRGQRVAGERLIVTDPDGTRRILQATASPLLARDGTPLGAVVTTRDETARLEMESELRERSEKIDEARRRAEGSEAEQRRARAEAERQRALAEEANAAKDRFFAMVSHELRTPLTSILGWAHMLRTRPELLAKGVDTIERNAKAQAQLIEDMFDSARIVSGKLSIEPAPFFVAGAIDAAIDSARPSASAKGLRLEHDVDPEIGTITADAGRFQQVISNLLANAMKFTPRDGSIRVVASRIDADLEVTVEDSGIGIDPAFLPHVFERFRQSDPRAGGGLGLGLAIVRAIVELHGGRVAVQSDGPGKGARFSVRFPMQAPERARPTETRTRARIPRVLVGASLLVVDDEADSRDVTVACLEQAGASVRTASSVDEALELLASWTPDAIVSDIGMPGSDGYAFIHELRTSETLAPLRFPVVALTAFARGEDRRRALTAGFTSYISKPVDPNELAVVVANALGRELRA